MKNNQYKARLPRTFAATLLGGALLASSSLAVAEDPVTLKFWALVNENYPESWRSLLRT